MSYLRKLTYSSLFIYLFSYPVVLLGILLFVLTRRTPKISYASMRKIYAVRGSGFIKTISFLCNNLDYKSNQDESWSRNSIFDYSASQVQTIVETVKKDGYCVFPYQLPENYIAQLTQVATDAECTIRQATVPGVHKINLQNPVGPWYNISERDLVSNENVIRLAQDTLFLDISKTYLGKTPINDLLALWWTIPFKNADKDVLAQMYHFDLDHLSFIKFFIYLTDVDLSNGPHCFIRGSHVRKNSKLNQDRRYTDDEILDNYGKENEVIMTGRKGMILAEDTRGFHKGLSPVNGHRLMFQLEYASSLFGQDYDRYDIRNESPETYLQFKKHPTLWQRFLS